jgi:hypothetical protein
VSESFVYWQDGEHWIGHFEDFPDYMTQGKSFEELKANLKDLYLDLTSGQIPCVRRKATLKVA